MTNICLMITNCNDENELIELFKENNKKRAHIPKIKLMNCREW